MKSSEKNHLEHNSLEIYLLETAAWYKAHRDRVLMGVAIFLIALAAILFFRFSLSGGDPQAKTHLDEAYYLSTAQSAIGFAPVADAAPFEVLAGRYKTGDDAALIRITLGEIGVKSAQSEITAKVMNSQADTYDEAVFSADPAVGLTKAIEYFDEVTTGMTSDPLLNARAKFGHASACEYLASIAAEESQVTERLEQAVANYRKLATDSPDSPYAKIAQQRADALSLPLAEAFYKQAADKYVHLPIPEPKPAVDSILSGKTLEEALDPSNQEEFGILNELPPTDADTPPAP